MEPKSDYSNVLNHIQTVTSLEELLSTPFQGTKNAICWNRKLVGDFSEIVNHFEFKENLIEISPEELLDLNLSVEGKLAREILLNDLKVLQDEGASPSINLIKSYERDEPYSVFPADVYSFHVDRSPIPTATFLCTYFGATSEILPNSQAKQKILIPEIRSELEKIHPGSAEEFDDFLKENFFDLHYQELPAAKPIKLGLGHLCKIAVDHPASEVLPCIHRAPKETNGQTRLLLIC